MRLCDPEQKIDTVIIFVFFNQKTLRIIESPPNPFIDALINAYKITYGCGCVHYPDAPGRGNCMSYRMDVPYDQEAHD